jgi:hypothetical protein
LIISAFPLLAGEKVVTSHKKSEDNGKKVPPAKKPTLKEGQTEIPQKPKTDLPGADGPLDAGAEEDTYD